MADAIECDYIIIGAGSAGCVLADRLSADGSRVVLLEAGPRDWHPMIHVPAGILHLLHNPRINWMYASEPDAGTNGRAIHWPRGRVLGGSSSINGMLFIRGNAADLIDRTDVTLVETVHNIRDLFALRCEADADRAPIHSGPLMMDVAHLDQLLQIV